MQKVHEVYRAKHPLESFFKLDPNDPLTNLIWNLRTCMMKQVQNSGSSEIVFVLTDYITFNCRKTTKKQMNSHLTNTYSYKTKIEFYLFMPRMKRGVIKHLDLIIEKTKQFLDVGEIQLWQIEKYVMQHTT